MATYKLYGVHLSTCTRTVMMTLEEIGQSYDLELVNMLQGEHKTPEYIKKQHPFGQVPVLWDGDYKLFESRAIARYLCDKHHSSLYPTDLKKRSLVEQWLSVCQSDLSALNILFEFFISPKVFATTPDESKRAGFQAALDKFLTVLENQLNQTKYLAGDEFTLGDLAFLPYITFLLLCPGFEKSLDKYSHVRAWWQAISTRPTWQKVSSKM